MGDPPIEVEPPVSGEPPLFDEPPVDGAKVEVVGNEFRNVRHHPILVARSDRGFSPTEFVRSNNRDVQVPSVRDDQRDPEAYHVVPPE